MPAGLVFHTTSVFFFGFFLFALAVGFDLVDDIVVETEFVGVVTVAAFKHLYLMGFSEGYQEHLNTLERELAKIVNQICNRWYFHLPVVATTSCGRNRR